jgi:hypothetical protein
MTDWIMDEAATAAIPWARLFGRGEEAGRERPARLPAVARAVACLGTADFPRRIETAQLVLEVPKVEDLPFVERMASDPSMFRFSERGPMSPEESWSLLLRTMGASSGWSAAQPSIAASARTSTIFPN